MRIAERKANATGEKPESVANVFRPKAFECRFGRKTAFSMPRHGEVKCSDGRSVVEVLSVAPFLQREGACMLDEFEGFDCHR